MRPSSLLALTALLAFAAQPAPCRAVHSRGFLQPASTNPNLSRREAVLLELREALRYGQRSHSETDLARLEQVLEPIYLALPRDAAGRLSAGSASYALHRVFMKLHGWRLRGMDFTGVGRAGLAEQEIGGEQDHMPNDVRALLRERLPRGVDLHELAALAAALEHMVQSDAERRLRAIFAAKGHRRKELLDMKAAGHVVDAYVATFVLGVDEKNITKRKLRSLMANILDELPGFPESSAFMRNVLALVVPTSQVRPISYEDLTRVIEEFSGRFGKWQNEGCVDLKESLVSLEERPNSGRVTLKRFYDATVNDDKWFDEHPEFLESQGALENTTAGGARVVIPNYLSITSNCLAEIRYYSVCCIDVCEDLFAELEGHFMAPAANVTDIVAFVATLPLHHGANVSRGTLPGTLVTRLEEIAKYHGGQVPIHGRLFAQWMHHVYPRDCLYPHISGTDFRKPLSTRDFEAETGRGYRATLAEMEEAMRAQDKDSDADGGAAAADDEDYCKGMPWEHEEELLDPTPGSAAAIRRLAKKTRQWWRRVLSLILPLVTASIALVRLVVPFWTRTAPLRGVKVEKSANHLV